MPTISSWPRSITCSSLFFFNDTATTQTYTLSLHDALPICGSPRNAGASYRTYKRTRWRSEPLARSEEHTSELQSRENIVFRLLLEKKKAITGSPFGLEKNNPLDVHRDVRVQN